MLPSPPASEPHPDADAVLWRGHMSDDVAATYGPEPMAFLSVTPRELLLSGSRGTYRIPRDKVRKLGRGKLYPWLFAAVHIGHLVGAFPSALQFKPLGAKPREVLARLRELGYPTA